MYPRKCYSILFLALVSCAAVTSVSMAEPSISGRVDGMPFTVPPGLFIADRHSPVSILEMWETNFPGGDQITISAEFDPDPIVNYSIAVTDFGDPSNFSFSFGQSIILPGIPNLVDAQVGGALNDATGNGVSITPMLSDSDGDLIAELQVSTVGFGTPSVNMGVDVGPAQSFPGAGSPGITTYSTVVELPQPGPNGAFDVMDTTVSFTLSGGGDFAALTGFAQIVPIPEPSTFVLAACGIIGILAIRRWSRD